MTRSTSTISVAGLSPQLLEHLLREHRQFRRPALARLWDYYRNPALESPDQGPTPLAQQRGLPDRLRTANSARREIVIENDIAWRIHTLVDFMVGKPVVLQSCAPQRDRATLIENFLRSVLDHNGGTGLLQDLALLGAVYGYADVMLSVAHSPTLDAAQRFALGIIAPPRAVPVLDPNDYRRLDAYLVNYDQTLNELDDTGVAARLRRALFAAAPGDRRAVVERTLAWSAQECVVLEGSQGQRRVVDRFANRLGVVPVVHIQNLAQPFFYEGLSEVEPLIPLQDELNTRLSDRANRVTFQSFKMYLGKGIEKFAEQPIGPGQMWATDNVQASIEEFGGDGQSPSEEAHINEIRLALDKASGVTPVAAGILRDKVGNLTSENALRVVLMGLLARTEKKRLTYGQGLQRLCDLILHAADVLDVLPNKPDERRIRLEWPSAIPENQTQRLQDAQLKRKLGVPPERVLAELGYDDCIKDHSPV